jgi:hypothetical protein
MMIDAPRYVRSEFVLSREVEAGLLLLSPGGQDVISLSGAGPEIWTLLRDPHTVEELVASLAARFDVPPTGIEEDVRAALTSLQQADVVRSDAA